MSGASVDVHTGADGSLVVSPHGDVGADCATELRQVLVHFVRRVRPLRLILDLRDVSGLDAINMGALTAVCDLADDHQFAIFVHNPSATIAQSLIAAGVPRQRLRHRPTPV